MFYNKFKNTLVIVSSNKKSIYWKIFAKNKTLVENTIVFSTKNKF